MNRNVFKTRTEMDLPPDGLRVVQTQSFYPPAAPTEHPVESFYPSERPLQPKMEAIVRYLIQNLNQPVSVTTLSAIAQLSPSALFLSFKRATGHPPIAFLIRARMELASKLLKETNLQIKQVAAAVGYPDEFHFSRRFKSAMGMAPRHYRLAMQKQRSEFQNRTGSTRPCA